MSKHLQRDLTAIERSLSQQASVVEQMVQTAYRGLRERCLGTAAEILAQESALNASEVRIEEECLETLALHQPVAIDLRRTATAIKINADLERIGDLALNLAERTEALASHPEVPNPTGLEEMVERALAMLHDAHRAFVTLDVKLAHSVCRRDDEVDAINREVIQEIITAMERRPDHAAGYLHLFSASRIVERIGDHATNISEDVIYLVEGVITRHRWATYKIA